MSKFRFDIIARSAREKMQRLHRSVGEMAVQHIKKVIFPSESFDGTPWKRPKKETKRPLLRKTDRMYNSIRVLRSSSRSVLIGTNVRYAKYHNEGTKYLPKRQFIGIDNGLRVKINLKLRQSLPSLFKK
jgi:phage gpG-like protein